MHFKLFAKEIYQARRKELAKAVKGLIILCGNEETGMNYRDNWYPFRQDSTFLYYFGLDVAGLNAVIDTETGAEIIFGNDAGIDDIIWTGPLPRVEEMAEAVGVQHTAPANEAGAYVQQAVKKGRKLHILPPYRFANRLKLAEWLNTTAREVDHFVSEELIRAIVKQRSIKSAEEIKEIEEAVSISAEMHLAAMRYAGTGMKEYEVAAKVQETAFANGSRLAYPVILTVEGQTLHNHYYGNTLKPGDMVLVDAGAENTMHYAGDLTRTFPAGKLFTPKQKEVYQAVLDALEHAAALLKPGIPFLDVHNKAAEKLVEGLSAIGLMKGDPAEAVAAGAHTLFFQCGLGHMMGLDVHDMEDLGEQYVGYNDTMKKSTAFGWKSLRLGKPLEEGFVLTVEPGVYCIPELIDRWKAENKLDAFINYSKLMEYRDFKGIRIEDNYLITASGAKRLGKYCPKTIAEIEAIRE
ncbi:MAG: aminopeptidase P family protein [Chitinophagaceae bacterium]